MEDNLWEAIRQAAEEIRSARRFVLTTHIEPDADGLGSEVALADRIEAHGGTALILNPAPTPHRFRLLDPTGRIRTYLPTQPMPPCDLFVVVDTSVWAQLGPMEGVVRAHHDRCVVIDHHTTRDAIGRVRVTDAEAPCSGWLVLRIMDALGWPLSERSAKALFAALVFDTGWLRYNNARGPAYEMAHRLVRAGAVPHEIYLALEARQPISMLRLTGMAMAGLELTCGGALAVMTVTRKMLSQAGVDPAEVSNMVNHCYEAEGVHSAVLFVEEPNGEVKVSLRSRGVVDVSAVAVRYGGGGHPRAAGARLNLPLEEAKKRVVTDLCRAIRAVREPPTSA